MCGLLDVDVYDLPDDISPIVGLQEQLVKTPKQRDTALQFSKTNRTTDFVRDQSDKGETNSEK
jgi:hypothetical protein